MTVVYGAGRSGRGWLMDAATGFGGVEQRLGDRVGDPGGVGVGAGLVEQRVQDAHGGGIVVAADRQDDLVGGWPARHPTILPAPI